MATRKPKISDGRERRIFERFPMKGWALRYEVTEGELSGVGKTINISAGGVLFSTESALPKGESIRLTIDWPVRLNGVTALSLVVVGILIRTRNEEAAIAISRYDLRPADADTQLTHQPHRPRYF